ncbi:hypothetical protein R1sor_003154 [Riccia sorocarpa]|uniref:Uncharacterized protein n=1 Tax=Riccia sorocarpa TaxID=122646 RepID=A0ABD3H3V0_9MARC
MLYSKEDFSNAMLLYSKRTSVSIFCSTLLHVSGDPRRWTDMRKASEGTDSDFPIAQSPLEVTDAVLIRIVTAVLLIETCQADWGNERALRTLRITFIKCWTSFRKEVKVLQCTKKERLLALPEKEKTLEELSRIPTEELSVQQETQLQNLAAEVRELQAWNHHRWRLTCRERYLLEGDACTAFFFRKFRKRKSKTAISKLKTHDGQWLDNPTDIDRAVYTPYSNLYNSQPLQQRVVDVRASLLTGNPLHLSTEQVAFLDDTPSEKEILDSLWLLPSGKSPGPDGMNAEIMRLFRPIMGSLYCRVVLELWSSGSLHPHFK